MYAVIRTTVAIRPTDLNRSEILRTYPTLEEAHRIASLQGPQYCEESLWHYRRIDVAQVCQPIPDSEPWGFAESIAEPDRMAREMFRATPQEFQSDCHADALWHRDNGGGEYTPDDDWRVWLESEPEIESLVIQRAIDRAGYVVATERADGITTEYLCRRIPVTVVP